MWGYGGIPQLDQAASLEHHLGGKTFHHPHGAPFGLSSKLPWFHRYPSIFRTNRKRLNGVAMLVNICVPWMLFSVAFALFSFHYKTPVTCWLLSLLLVLVGAGTPACLLQRTWIRRERDEEEAYEPMWYGFLGITCLFAIITGIVLGFHNFDARLSKIYDLEQLATYRDIEPAGSVGQQLVDAGRVSFINGAHLDISKSMGFKDKDIYCVAPIVSPKTGPHTYVDFWAVGKNCCSGISSDFHCSGYDNMRAAGGLRLMDDAARPFYRLAVQQAEATYKISTHKPLFFVWHADPIQYTSDLKHSAIAMYIAGIITAFLVQCFLVTTATLVFAKIFPNR